MAWANPIARGLRLPTPGSALTLLMIACSTSWFTTTVNVRPMGMATYSANLNACGSSAARVVSAQRVHRLQESGGEQGSPPLTSSFKLPI